MLVAGFSDAFDASPIVAPQLARSTRREDDEGEEFLGPLSDHDLRADCEGYVHASLKAKENGCDANV